MAFFHIQCRPTYNYFRFWRPYCYFRLSVVVAIIWQHLHWTCHGRKRQICFWNFDAIHHSSRFISTSGLCGHIAISSPVVGCCRNHLGTLFWARCGRKVTLCEYSYNNTYYCCPAYQIRTLYFRPVVSSFFLLLSFFFFLLFPRLISAVGDWMFTILPHTMWPLCEFRMHVWNVLHVARWNTGRKSYAINCICAPLHNFVANKPYIDHRKKTC